MEEDNPVKDYGNKGGRPRLPPHEKRTNKIEVWLSDFELADLARMQEETALSRADVVRSLIAGRRIKRLSVPTVNLKTYSELGKIGSNVNQLAKFANEYGYGEGFKHLSELSDLINQVRREIMGGDDDSES